MSATTNLRLLANWAGRGRGRIVLPAEIASRFRFEYGAERRRRPRDWYFGLAAIPARYALERQAGKQAEQLAPRETPFPYTDAMTWFAVRLGAARLGTRGVGKGTATALQQIQERLLRPTSPTGAGRWNPGA